MDPISYDVCPDCLMFIANGTGPEYLTLEEDGDAKYEARLAEIVAGVEREQDTEQNSCLVAGDCRAEPFGLEEHSHEGSFSWSPCECCGSSLGGDRYKAALIFILEA